MPKPVGEIQSTVQTIDPENMTPAQQQLVGKFLHEHGREYGKLGRAPGFKLRKIHLFSEFSQADFQKLLEFLPKEEKQNILKVINHQNVSHESTVFSEKYIFFLKEKLLLGKSANDLSWDECQSFIEKLNHAAPEATSKNYIYGDPLNQFCLKHPLHIYETENGELVFQVIASGKVGLSDGLVGGESSQQKLTRKILGEGSFAKVDAQSGFIRLEKRKGEATPEAVYYSNESYILRRDSDSKAREATAQPPDVLGIATSKSKTNTFGLYCTGVTLDKAKISALSPENFLIFSYAFLQAIEEQVHNLGLVHCDIKPANVMIDLPLPEMDERGIWTSLPCIRVVDFGFAKRENEVLSASRGTPAFIAPEMHTSKDVIADFSADVYSAAAVLGHLAPTSLGFQRLPPTRFLSEEPFPWAAGFEIAFSNYALQGIQNIFQKALNFNSKKRVSLQDFRREIADHLARSDIEVKSLRSNDPVKKLEQAIAQLPGNFPAEMKTALEELHFSLPSLPPQRAWQIAVDTIQLVNALQEDRPAEQTAAQWVSHQLQLILAYHRTYKGESAKEKEELAIVERFVVRALGAIAAVTMTALLSFLLLPVVPAALLTGVAIVVAVSIATYLKNNDEAESDDNDKAERIRFHFFKPKIIPRDKIKAVAAGCLLHCNMADLQTQLTSAINRMADELPLKMALQKLKTALNSLNSTAPKDARIILVDTLRLLEDVQEDQPQSTDESLKQHKRQLILDYYKAYKHIEPAVKAVAKSLAEMVNNPTVSVSVGIEV